MIGPPCFEGQPANHVQGHLLANSPEGAGDDAIRKFGDTFLAQRKSSKYEFILASSQKCSAEW
jgi:hypothetical protein